MARPRYAPVAEPLVVEDPDECGCLVCARLSDAIQLVIEARRNGDPDDLLDAQRRLRLAAASVDKLHGLDGHALPR